MNRGVSLVFALSLVLAPPLLAAPRAPDAPPATSAQPCTPSDDDSAIYSAVLQEIILKDKSDETRAVLYSKTSAGLPPGLAGSSSSDAEDRQTLLAAADVSTRNDFDAKTSLTCDLPANIGPAGRVTLVTPEEEAKLFAKSGAWKTFGQKYPNAAGLTLLSGIGFNKLHTQALVYLGNSCGLLCGSGQFALLAKKHDKWVVQKTALLWTA
ncbi:MAG TPA: hypothetical protein VMM16_02450 [Verrucomicrobiae bacterium]|nr:hypothetical protein [Verrucomicrobiae bacterium]